MGHVNSVLMAISKCPNPTVFQKTLSVNDFYFAESDGSYRLNGWKMFWYGISDFDEIQRCVEHAHHRPATLIDAAPSQEAA